MFDLVMASACPLTLRLDVIAGMLNCELPDHPVYDGLELQLFDDEQHGAGLLAFLSRRDGHRIDYYVQPGLRLAKESYGIGGGIGSWTETIFDSAHLEITEYGVVADVRFTDVQDRRIEISVDDRDGRRRRPAGLLAPISAAVEKPESLMLVWMTAFDLVRTGPGHPAIRMDDEDVGFGVLPGAWLHRRHLIKYASGLVCVHVADAHDGPMADLRTGWTAEQGRGRSVSAITSAEAGHRARLEFSPELPPVDDLVDAAGRDGAWRVFADGVHLTGGTWTLRRSGTTLDMVLDVSERWRPGRLPALMRFVTSVVPVFQRWPTTYRWRGRIELSREPSLTGAWERVPS